MPEASEKAKEKMKGKREKSGGVVYVLGRLRDDLRRSGTNSMKISCKVLP